jgi:hypothetical protein
MRCARKIIRHPINGVPHHTCGRRDHRPRVGARRVRYRHPNHRLARGLEQKDHRFQFRRISPCIRGGRRLFVMEGSREQFFSPGLTPPAAWRPGGINPRASATPNGALRKILLLPPQKPVDLLHIKIRLQSRSLQPRRKGKSHVSITQ